MPGRPPKLIQQTADLLLADWVDSKLPGDRLPSTTDLMKQYQVSRNTIKGVFRELQRSKTISILSTGKAVVAGAVSNKLKKLLGKQIAFVGRRIDTLLEDSFCRRVISGFATECRPAGIDFMFTNCDWTGNGNRTPIHHFASSKIAAIVVLEKLPQAHLKKFRLLPKPKVAVDFDAVSAGIDSFSFDNEHGAELLARRLHQLGHRRVVAIVESPEKSWETRDAAWTARRRGFLEGWAKMEVRPVTEVQLQQRGQTDQAIRRIKSLLDLPKEKRPTGFFIPTPDWLPTLTNLAKERRLKIPRDFSVLGVEDVSAHKILTGIHYPTEQLGKEAAGHLLRLLQDPKWKKKKRNRYKVKGRYIAGKTHGKGPLRKR